MVFPKVSRWGEEIKYTFQYVYVNTRNKEVKEYLELNYNGYIQKK